MHLKKLSKLVNFCVATLILKMEENTQHFWHILYYFKKGKNSWNAKKDACSVWRGCCDWSNMLKVVCEGSCWRFLARLNAPRSVDQLKLVVIKLKHWEQSTLYHMGDSWRTQNIQINKGLGENEKCVSYFMEKTIQTIWPTR